MNNKLYQSQEFKSGSNSEKFDPEPRLPKTHTFADFELDERLLKAVYELGWDQPTPVQQAMIPLALEHKNIMARARTGSGKTGAFLLPMIQSVIQHLASNATNDAGDTGPGGPIALIIAPTKELAGQIHELLARLTAGLPFIQHIDLARLGDAFDPSQGDGESLDIVVTTPSRLIAALRRHTTSSAAASGQSQNSQLQPESRKKILKSAKKTKVKISSSSVLSSSSSKKSDFLYNVRHVVLDEADLLFSYGYREELLEIRTYLSMPSLCGRTAGGPTTHRGTYSSSALVPCDDTGDNLSYQTIMTSATLNEDMTELKRIFLSSSSPSHGISFSTARPRNIGAEDGHKLWPSMLAPVVSLQLREPPLPGPGQLEQFHIRCQNDEQRMAILIALIKLRLIVGKSVVFVSSTNRCYQLHLFLQTFKVPSCVLNSQMPANSRCRTIAEFNDGKWPFIIASESNDLYDPEEAGLPVADDRNGHNSGTTKTNMSDDDGGAGDLFSVSGMDTGDRLVVKMEGGGMDVKEEEEVDDDTKIGDSCLDDSVAPGRQRTTKKIPQESPDKKTKKKKKARTQKNADESVDKKRSEELLSTSATIGNISGKQKKRTNLTKEALEDGDDSCLSRKRQRQEKHQEMVENGNDDGPPTSTAAAAAAAASANDGTTKPSLRKQKVGRERWRHVDRESGIGRGIDFHQVSNVINVDFPTSTEMYIHRVGRTARGLNKGTALSFVTDREEALFEKVRTDIEHGQQQRGGQGGRQNEKITTPGTGMVIQPYEVQMKEFEGFLLRARDVLSACTRSVVQETRLAEIRHEILRSRRLDAYFAKNPREKAALDQDRARHQLSVHSACIADVPDYLVPKPLRGQLQVHKQKQQQQQDGGQKKKWRGHVAAARGARRKHLQRMADPLQSLKF